VFETLTARFETAFDRIRGRGRLSERQVDETLREVRLALLEADVNQEVADRLLDRIRVRAVGAEVIRSVTPGHQVVKIVHESLLETLGSEAVPLVTTGGKPLTTLVVGLQGSGKTTTAAKLADHYRRSGKSVLMVAGDLVRPGAVEQLQQLGERIGVPVFEGGGRNPVSVVRSALRQADREGLDVVVVDTAGRLQIDRDLMTELGAMARTASPDEVLLVLDAMTGQESVAVARGFSKHIDLTGVVLSKLDSDARGGAAISVREATGFPVKLVGTGEGHRDLEVFHPERMASRILGMGDVLTLIERAEEAVDQQQAADMAQRLLRAEFTLDDYIEQVKSLRRMGSVGELLGMIPGARPAMADAQAVDREVRRSEAIICSMTRAERANPKVIDGSRRRRIALGSGTSVQDVAGLVRQFNQMRGMFQSLSRGKTRMGFPGMRGGFPGSVEGALPGGLMGTVMERPRGGGRRRPAGRPKKKPRTPKKLQKKKKR